MQPVKLVMQGGVAVAAIAIAGLASGQANAAVYAKVEAGTTANAAVNGINLDDDSVYGGELGMGVGPIRVEAGVDRINASLAGGAVQAHANDWNATAYFDLPLSSKSGVFAGAGVDYVQAEAHTPFGGGISGEGKGWHVTAGLARRMGDGLIMEVAAKHVDCDLDFGGSSTVNATADTFTIGARFSL